MSAAFTYRQKMDINYCDDKTGFPRPGHNFNSTLHNLRMSECQLSLLINEIGQILFQCNFIVFIDFSFNKIIDNGIKVLINYLKNINTLQYLDLSGNNITAVGVDHLSKLITSEASVLTSIVLSRNPLKDEGVRVLLQAITNFMECVEFVDVSMTSSSYQCIANTLHKVKSIGFTVCEDSEIISNSIANATMLQHIKLSDMKDSYFNIIDGINEKIEIISLDYSHSGHGDSFERLVRYNKSVTKLNIKISSYIHNLASVIRKSCIKSLHIRSECCLSQQDLVAYIEEVLTNCTIEELVFRYESIYLSTIVHSKNIRTIMQNCHSIYTCIQNVNHMRDVANQLRVSIYM